MACMALYGMYGIIWHIHIWHSIHENNTINKHINVPRVYNMLNN